MEKRNYLKPDFALNNIKTTSFIAASVESGEGGLTCSDPISEQVLEDLFWVNTNYTGNNDGPFSLDYLKEYLRRKGSATIHCGLDYTSRVDRVVKEENCRWNCKTWAEVGGMSFEKNANYTITLVSGVNGDCIQFTKSNSHSYIVNLNY